MSPDYPLNLYLHLIILKCLNLIFSFSFSKSFLMQNIEDIMILTGRNCSTLNSKSSTSALQLRFIIGVIFHDFLFRVSAILCNLFSFFCFLTWKKKKYNLLHGHGKDRQKILTERGPKKYILEGSLPKEYNKLNDIILNFLVMLHEFHDCFTVSVILYTK